MRIITLALFGLMLCVSIAYGGDRGYEYSYEGYDYDSQRGGAYDHDMDTQWPEPRASRSRSRLSANEYGSRSLSNRYRFEDHPHGLDSLTNEYGEGSPYKFDGWNNEYSFDGGLDVGDDRRRR